MRILGIDPGYGIVGFGVVDRISSSKISYVGSGCIRTDAGLEFPARLDEIAQDLKVIIDQYKPDVCAIEQLFFAKNTTTALKVAEARGVIVQNAYKNGMQVFEYSPLQIKMALTSDGSAKKNQVKQMVEIFLNHKNIQGPDDTLDALAVAICHSSSNMLIPQT